MTPRTTKRLLENMRKWRENPKVAMNAVERLHQWIDDPQCPPREVIRIGAAILATGKPEPSKKSVILSIRVRPEDDISSAEIALAIQLIKAWKAGICDLPIVGPYKSRCDKMTHRDKNICIKVGLTPVD